MAWLSSGETNEELVENMRKGGLIESDVVADVSHNLTPYHFIVLKLRT